MFFFFNDTATTEIYTLSLHDALPISNRSRDPALPDSTSSAHARCGRSSAGDRPAQSAARMKRSEEHTSELQSRPHLVCRLLLEKKKRKIANRSSRSSSHDAVSSIWTH